MALVDILVSHISLALSCVFILNEFVPYRFYKYWLVIPINIMFHFKNVSILCLEYVPTYIIHSVFVRTNTDIGTEQECRFSLNNLYSFLKDNSSTSIWSSSLQTSSYIHNVHSDSAQWFENHTKNWPGWKSNPQQTAQCKATTRPS